jgi:IclR family acetate operon transcriptional repressor
MKSLNKALDILEVFVDLGGGEIRLSELAQLTGLNKATVSRIVSALVKRGYMSQVERRGKYILGAKFLNFGAVIKQKNRIKDIAMPHLVKLNQLVEESVALFSLDREKAVFIEEVHSKYILRLPPDTTAMPPLYCTAIGKILLASKAARELERYLHNTDIKAYTPNTITDLNRLKSQLMTVAKEGVAYDDEELYPGFRSVAAGIRDAEERLVAGVGVQGPSVRFTRAIMKEIAPDVKHCAMAISIDLGYRDK